MPGLALGARFGGQTTENLVITVITLILAIVAIVLMWRGSSSQWYEPKQP